MLGGELRVVGFARRFILNGEYCAASAAPQLSRTDFYFVGITKHIFEVHW